MFTQDMLKEALHYDPATGIFTWIKNTGKKRLVGRKAGVTAAIDGRVLIGIYGERHRAHRLAWLYMTGEWPKEDIDHIDGKPSNNKFANLRAASRSENLGNTKLFKNNKAGVKGVWLLPNGKWRARIRKNHKITHLGCFLTKEEAAEAYYQAALMLHGEFANPG